MSKWNADVSCAISKPEAARPCRFEAGSGHQTSERRSGTGARAPRWWAEEIPGKRKTAMTRTAMTRTAPKVAAAALIASMFLVTGCEALLGGAVGAGATGGGYELHLNNQKKDRQSVV